MQPEPAVATATLETPIGTLRLAASEAGLTRLMFANDKTVVAGARSHLDKAAPPAAARTHLENAVAALEAYFAGARRRFDDLTLAPDGTAFQRRVWRALEAIPFGETRSYGEIAATIGKPKAMRAVGLANNRNPIGIIVPCHRVIGADGSLTGFGGGLPAKQWLLVFEGAREPALI